MFIVGVGAGNTTRNIALIHELRRAAPDIDIHVAAQGRAADLLEAEALCPVHRLRTVTYGTSGSMGLWNVVRSNLSFPRRFFQNRAEARRLLESLRPDVAMADSDFYCLGVAKRRRVPLASLNNSPVVVAALRRMGTPRGCGFSARVIERLDSWLQHRYPDRVICPVLRREEGLDERITQIHPIVRQGIEPWEGEGESVVVVTGGSGLGTDDIDLRGVTEPVVTYGTHLERVPPQTEQRGFTLDVIEAMRRAKVLVVQGGFSSVSEAVALRRPTVVVPITGHAEQHVNARLFEEMGLGLAAARATEAGAKVLEILGDLRRFEDRAREHRIATDGAREAARILLEMIG
jgi:uncharacterized protein (TIGR00661 family)